MPSKEPFLAVSQPPHPLYRLFLRFDARVGSAFYEFFDALGRAWGAYDSFLARFKITGLRRVVVDTLDDAATFGLVAAIGLVTLALPPFSDTGDIWNRGRQYAVTLTDINGEIIGRRGVRQDDAVPLDEIPPHVIRAVLATEDARFFGHFGVDVFGTFRAMLANAQANDVVQGGSTLTQQLAKNLFLTPERSIKRKINEAFLALWIEARLTKPEILKMYLDRSYLGGGTYGVEAAAQFYFGKSIRDVTLSEAAVLAGLFKAPSKYAPHVNIDVARARANVVLYRMLDVGFISQGELFEAKRRPADVVSAANQYSPGYFLDWAYREALVLLDEKKLQGDYAIEVKTTVDLALQRHAQKVLDEMLDNEAPAYSAHQASLVSMAPDGALKAIVGGRDYEESQFNRATDALRQPGSSFKPFVYLAALMAGYTPDTVVWDSPVSIGSWAPKNYSLKYAGKTTLTTALARSFNSVPVRLMLDIGRKPIIDTAHLVGLKSNLLAVPSLPLGTNEVTLMDITTGYATFANGGRLAQPYSVLEMRRPNGEVIYTREGNVPPAPQVVPEQAIADLNHMLHEVVVRGTGRRAFLGFTPQAGKTGTNQSYRDAWYIGYTAHHVTGVWFGNDDFSEMKKVTGGLLPAEAWKRFMVEAEATKVAAALPGVPLDDSYAKYIAENQGKLDLPLLQTVAAGDAQQPGPQRGRANAIPSEVAVENPSEGQVGDVTVHQPKKKERSDAVVEVLQDMFGLFKSDPEPRKRSAQRSSNPFVNLFTPGSSGEERRAKRADTNTRRLKLLLDR